MLMKKNIFLRVLSLFLIVSTVLPGIAMTSQTAFAQELGSCAADEPGCLEGAQQGPIEEQVVATPICDTASGRVDVEDCDCNTQPLTPGTCSILRYIQTGINILSGLAALAIIGGIMSGGYMYMTARDNPGQTAAARQRVAWAVGALFILIFFWGFLQWLIPGGVLNGASDGACGGGFC